MAEKREEKAQGRESRELSPWRPFGDFEQWLTPWEGLFPRRRLFEELFRDFPARSRAFVPAVELSENDQSYTITVEIPGVNKEDVHVDLQEGMLVIHGEKKSEREEKKERGRYIERSYGSFSRSFTLPADANAERLDASFRDGVLKIVVPRSEAAKPRQIAIKG
ncbi:MAG TPA: Hsp20/alpha crystallin family protein [Myxococcota bacterium]|nr:Hsp20/alpha crystallin family protein [Myxococcota bacterium]